MKSYSYTLTAAVRNLDVYQRTPFRKRLNVKGNTCEHGANVHFAEVKPFFSASKRQLRNKMED